jgi:hypothetical protein
LSNQVRRKHALNSGRRNSGGQIIGRNHGGEMMEEESWKRTHGGGIM